MTHGQKKHKRRQIQGSVKIKFSLIFEDHFSDTITLKCLFYVP